MTIEKVIWSIAIIGIMLVPTYIFFSARSESNTFTTGPITIDILNKTDIEQLCNTTLSPNQKVMILDNTSRNSFGPYNNNSVYCSKSNESEYDFILNSKQG